MGLGPLPAGLCPAVALRASPSHEHTGCGARVHVYVFCHLHLDVRAVTAGHSSVLPTWIDAMSLACRKWPGLVTVLYDKREGLGDGGNLRGLGKRHGVPQCSLGLVLSCSTLAENVVSSRQSKLGG